MRFLCNGDLRARAARVYDASNIKEEISSTSDRKKVLPLRHDGVLFERASSLDVFDERERERDQRSEIVKLKCNEQKPDTRDGRKTMQKRALRTTTTTTRNNRRQR